MHLEEIVIGIEILRYFVDLGNKFLAGLTSIFFLQHHISIIGQIVAYFVTGVTKALETNILSFL